MKNGQNISGTYSNGISTWDFSGTINGIHWDTAGGNFGEATIVLDSPIVDSWGMDRGSLLITLDARGNVADSRYNLD